MTTSMRLLLNEARLLFSGIDVSLNSFNLREVESLYSMSFSEFDVEKLESVALG